MVQAGRDFGKGSLFLAPPIEKVGDVREAKANQGARTDILAKKPKSSIEGPIVIRMLDRPG